MTKQMGYMGEAAAEPNKALVLTLAEICLRPADLLDTAIRRLVTAGLARDTRPEPRISSLGAGASTQRQPPMTMDGSLSEVQAAIGRHLRAEYDLAQPIPGRLVELLRKLEEAKAGPNGLH
jgi:hypothetical protein